MFYLKFMEPNMGQGRSTWNKLAKQQSYKIWSGFSFETVCLKHIEQIKKELGIAKNYSINSSWHNEHAQVDLVIDRDDGIINLCEMKFYDRPFALTKEQYESIRNKAFRFKDKTKTRKSVFVTMVTTFGLIQNAYSLEQITDDFTLDYLFEEV